MHACGMMSFQIVHLATALDAGGTHPGRRELQALLQLGMHGLQRVGRALAIQRVTLAGAFAATALPLAPCLLSAISQALLLQQQPIAALGSAPDALHGLQSVLGMDMLLRADGCRQPQHTQLTASAMAKGGLHAGSAQ